MSCGNCGGCRVVQHRMTAEIYCIINTLFQCWKQPYLLTIILNIIIETSITSANKHNFSVEHLFKNKLSLRDF
jgi:hypothetical protein